MTSKYFTSIDLSIHVSHIGQLHYKFNNSFDSQQIEHSISIFIMKQNKTE